MYKRETSERGKISVQKTVTETNKGRGGRRVDNEHRSLDSGRVKNESLLRRRYSTDTSTDETRTLLPVSLLPS